MYKIDIKITYLQLSVLVDTFKIITAPPINHRETRVARSVLDKVVLKLKQKHLKETAKLPYLNKEKAVKHSFEYHEAHYLERFLNVVTAFTKQDYEYAVILNIAAKINQKLA